MKITEAQIDLLFEFTRQHYVEYYDVQSELVDHLANDIEAIWKENPKLTFEQARDKSFKKFGIFGFADVVKARESAMTKKYWKLILRFSKEWLTIPKIISTFLIFLLVYFLLQVPKSEFIVIGAMFLAIIFEFYRLFRNRKTEKKRMEKKQRIFLLESMIGTTRNSYAGLTFINIINFINLSETAFVDLTPVWLSVISGLITLLVIFFYVINFILPQKAQELLEETYPEYKIVNSL